MSQHLKGCGGKLSFKPVKQNGNKQTQREEEEAGGKDKRGQDRRRKGRRD